MKLLSLRIPALAFLTVAAACSAGCETHRTNPATDIQTRMSANLHPALRGTVGEFAALVDAAPMRVEGWGIVAELPNTGSPIMDPRIHELMLNHLLTIGIGMYSTGTEKISPEAILASRQIAIVEIRGVIPPLARRGSTFDLYVNAIPGSGTTSIAHGLLWPSDLKQLGLTFEGNDTRTIATGRGPVFIPGSLEAEADLAAGAKPADTRKALRSGRIIAGGVCAEDRDARLQLYTPDWMRTRLIERAIVARFPGREKPAAAADQSVIELHIPPEYRDNPMDFVDLARHLYITTDAPGFIENKAAELIAALKDPNSPHRDLGLALQGLGRSILPDYLQPNYTSSNLELRFWCARAGACLQDAPGLVALQDMVARNPGSPLRRQALLAMIEASRGRDTELATRALYEMIRSNNTDDRILAYHALLAIRSPAVSTYDVGRKFMLDIIPADSPPLIYVLEADSPRIAFIGRDLKLAPGTTVLSKDNLLAVRVDDAPDNPALALAPVLLPGMTAAKPKEKDSATLSWISPLHDKTQILHSLPSLPALVARVCWVPDPLSKKYDPADQFIGASYQRITELLAGMCADKTIDATFVVERTPDLIVNPTEQALSIRPEGSARMTPPDTPKPPSDAPNAPDAGAPLPR
jgi:hypothetical protein